MGLPVTVYRWDDAGAPQLTGRTPSDFIDVLKKVLVYGYGTKVGLGWSIAFEDVVARKIAFRNSTVDGSGGFVQFWCPEGSNTIGSRFSYKSAQGMSGLDNFTKPSSLGNIWSTGTQSLVTHWMIVGTTSGFYLFTLLNNTATYDKQGNNSSVVFIGDIHSNYNNDAGRFMSLTNTTADASASSAPYNIFESGMTRLYQTDGSITSLVGTMIKIVSTQTGGSASKDSDDIALGVNFATGMVVINAPSAGNVVDSNGTPVNNSLLQPFFRGVMPGLLSSSFIGYRNKTFPQFRTINGKLHVLSANSQTLSIGCGMWLNIEEWY